MRALPAAIAAALRETGALDDEGRDEEPGGVTRLRPPGKRRHGGPGPAAAGADA